MKLRRSLKRLRRAIARRFARSHSHVIIFDVAPNRVYTLEGRCSSPAGALPKSGVAIVTFTDAAGTELPGPYSGLSHSDKLGCYQYLAAGPPDAPALFTLNVITPEAASRARVVVRPWRKHPLVLPEGPQWRELGPALDFVMTFDVAPNRVYTLEGRCSSPAGALPKSGVAIVTFADAAGTELPGPYSGLSHSDKVGCYQYLAAGPPEAPAPFNLKVMAPKGACSARIALQPWQHKTLALAEAPVWRELCLAPDEQKRVLLHEWQALLARCRQDVGKPLVVISSTTKPINENQRSNRPMRIALELAELGCLTIYVYHGDALAALPSKIHPNLIQMRYDIFHEIASGIAACDIRNLRVFISSIPDWHAVHEITLFKNSGWSTIYEVRDDWEEFHNAKVASWYDHLFERYLCQRADKVVAVSPLLCQKMIAFGASSNAIHLIPNGTPQAFLDKACHQRQRRRARTYVSERPMVGYFGHLGAAFFHWTLVLATAAARPELNFQIIGFDAPDGLDLPANVQLIGPRSHDDIIELAEPWSLAIIPRRLGKLSRAMDPIKVYDYLALGLKCVAPPMGQLERYPLTFVYGSEDQFGATIEDALRYTPSTEDWTRVERLVTRATWRKRAQEVLDLIPRTERDGVGAAEATQ